jgi:hypothetical protein
MATPAPAEKSKGHVCFALAGDDETIFEYVLVGRDLYRTRVRDTYIDVFGYRSGLRFESTTAHAGPDGDYREYLDRYFERADFTRMQEG